MKIQLFFLLILLHLIPMTAFAQGRVWTIKACIDTAIKNNKNFKALEKPLTLNVLSAYQKILFDLEQIETTNKKIEELQKRLRQTESLIKEGKQSPTDLLTIEMQLETDKITLVNIVGDLTYDQITLMLLMNIPAEVDFEIEKICSSVIEDLQKQAQVYNPTLLQDQSFTNRNE